MIIAGTGHRCDKLPNKQTGYTLPNPTYNYICQEVEKVLLQHQPEKVISGFAQGFDQYLAHVTIKLGIPLIAAIPFVGQEKIWPAASQLKYNKLLSQAAEVVIVSAGGYTASKMQIRNCWMADRCDKLLACWNHSAGGTSNCIDYAKSISKDIIYIDPRLAI